MNCECGKPFPIHDILTYVLQAELEEICPKCSGFGRRAYGSTATWGGGMGGQAITGDICDNCWGSGDAKRPFSDLHKAETRYKRVVEALTALMYIWTRDCDIPVDKMLSFVASNGPQKGVVHVFTDKERAAQSREIVSRLLGSSSSVPVEPSVLPAEA